MTDTEVDEMTIIRRPSPFGELMSLRQAMDRLFEDSYVRPTRSLFGGLAELLPLDIRHDRDELVVQAALPGVKPEDVDVNVSGERLTISGEKKSAKESKGNGWVHRETACGAFSRTLTLPDSVDPAIKPRIEPGSTGPKALPNDVLLGRE